MKEAERKTEFDKRSGKRTKKRQKERKGRERKITVLDVLVPKQSILIVFQSAGLSSSSALVCCSALATVHANGLELSKVPEISAINFNFLTKSLSKEYFYSFS